MSEAILSVEEPVKASEDMIAEVVGKMPTEHRKFLVSLKRGEPDWKLLALPGAEELPALRWRLQNPARWTKTKEEKF